MKNISKYIFEVSKKRLYFSEEECLKISKFIDTYDDSLSISLLPTNNIGIMGDNDEKWILTLSNEIVEVTVHEVNHTLKDKDLEHEYSSNYSTYNYIISGKDLDDTFTQFKELLDKKGYKPSKNDEDEKEDKNYKPKNLVVVDVDAE